jgi:hypothetical protein
MSLDDPGLQMALTNLDKKIDSAVSAIHDLDTKFDAFTPTVVTQHQYQRDFDYRKLMTRWGIGLMITIIIAAAGIIASRPGPFFG